MDNIIYDSLVKYYKILSHLGYKSYNDVYKILFLIAVNKFIKTFGDTITKDDHRLIERSIYKVYGTRCLIPFPNYCSIKNIGKLLFK